MSIQRGLFITIEGGEGVGKSTNLEFVEHKLRGHGVDLVVSREPGGTPLAESIRQLLLDEHTEPLSDMTELLLMFAARAQHVQQLIAPSLAQGKWVLCDRFTDATYAYQSGGRGIPREHVLVLERLVQGDLKPDYTLLLDAPPEVGMSRASTRGKLDRFEQEEIAFFRRVRSEYLRLAEGSSGRFRVIDAAQSLPDVQRQLDKACAELLSCWGVRQEQ